MQLQQQEECGTQPEYKKERADEQPGQADLEPQLPADLEVRLIRCKPRACRLTGENETKGDKDNHAAVERHRH